MKKLNIVSVFAIAFLISPTFASAASQGGNLFSCEGKDFKVGFSSSSFTGDPHYSVQDIQNGVKLDLISRKDIRSTATPMGTLITATYSRLALADGPTYHYNLVIPAHELGMAESLKIETQMIRTTVISPFHPHGMSMQIQHNEIFPVTCEVQRVVF